METIMTLMSCPDLVVTKQSGIILVGLSEVMQDYYLKTEVFLKAFGSLAVTYPLVFFYRFCLHVGCQWNLSSRQLDVSGNCGRLRD